ncbi:hypothetical protein ABZR11_27115 [Pseudomonas aeruginosa]|uniref:AbiU2 domain-containing protein n=1 Tax=Pseudomonas aeruginosa TaxID=287 RepID=UPI001BD36785|nr:hypothetical protein [Pseudomonas aeruginosa]ELP3489918.1 hypothetical protein [Pseudomonas aeruginosa]MDP5375303.1 hypothetical protein [Pseudomonas aeruginosa]HCE6032714.1 hypothetical protein [Pseudomonas aeruginosa]HCF4405958.1 hypothetical protein [Pseudomonas aeruginosa]
MAKPKNPAEVLERVGNELKLLWLQLDTYQELFLIEVAKRESLLRDTAPGFFAVTQVSLIESIFMRVFRLMDEAQMGGAVNCSFDALQRSLGRMPRMQRRGAKIFRLRLSLRALRKDWRLPNSQYSGLKKIRNKALAHNDYTHHARRGAANLWLRLSDQEFVLAQQLGSRMWGLYRQARLAIFDSDIEEPTVSQLKERPAMLLKHLCASRYLDHLIDTGGSPPVSLLDFELQCMGEDRIRNVFAVDGGGYG